MDGFTLHPRLAADSHELLRLPFSEVRLMRNAAVPWFILVPATSATEWFDLPDADARRLQDEAHAVARFVRDYFTVDKINLAAIGNIVSQLHVHVVGRREDDYCWPGVIWGQDSDERYAAQRVAEIAQALAAATRTMMDRGDTDG